MRLYERVASLNGNEWIAGIGPGEVCGKGGGGQRERSFDDSGKSE